MPAAAVVRDPDHGMAGAHAGEQQDGREHPRNELHDQPQFDNLIPIRLAMQTDISVLPVRLFVQMARLRAA